MTQDERHAAKDPMNAQGEEETELSGVAVDHATIAREVGRSTMTAGDDADDDDQATEEAERHTEDGDGGPG